MHALTIFLTLALRLLAAFALMLWLTTSLALAKEHRIISLSPAASELIYALGIEQYLVGVDHYSNYPLAVQQLPDVGDMFHTNIEEIILLHPSLIISYYNANQTLLKQLQEIIPVTQWNTAPENIDQLLDNARYLARFVAADNTTYQRIEEWQRRWDTIKHHRPPPSGKTFFVFLGEAPFYSVGNASFLSQSIEVCGVENILHDVNKSSVHVSTEFLIASPPDFIIAGVESSTHQDEASLRKSLYKKGLPLGNTRIIMVENDILFRPSIRFLEQLPTLCHALNPSAFHRDAAE